MGIGYEIMNVLSSFMADTVFPHDEYKYNTYSTQQWWNAACDELSRIVSLPRLVFKII